MPAENLKPKKSWNDGFQILKEAANQDYPIPQTLSVTLEELIFHDNNKLNS